MRESSHYKRSIASSNRRGRSVASSRPRSTSTRQSKKGGSKNTPKTPPTLLTLGRFLDAVIRLDAKELLKMAHTFANSASAVAEKATNPDYYINMCFGEEETTGFNADAFQKTFNYSEGRDPLEEGILPLPNNLDPLSPNFLQPDNTEWVPTSISFVPGRDDVSLDLTWFGPELKMQMQIQQQMRMQRNRQTLGEFLEHSKRQERRLARRKVRSTSRSRHRRSIPSCPPAAAVPPLEKCDYTIQDKSDDTVKAETKDVISDLKKAESARTTSLSSSEAQSQSNSGNLSQNRSRSRSDRENLSSDTTQESSLPSHQNEPLRVKLSDPDSNNMQDSNECDHSERGSMRSRSGLFRIFHKKDSSLHRRSVFASSPKNGQAKKESSLHRRTVMFLSRHRRKLSRKDEGRPPMKPVVANQ